VFTGTLDHTSILQLLDDKFLRGEGYSAAVNARQTHFNRILNALNSPLRGGTPPQLPIPARPKIAPTEVTPTAPSTANAQAFHQAAGKIAADHPELIAQPGWEKLRQYLANPNA
jgi:phospholipase C